MTITQIVGSIATTEKETGVIAEITGTEVMLTIQANTEITKAIGITTDPEVTEITENMADTGSTENIDLEGGRRGMLQTGRMGMLQTGRRGMLQAGRKRMFQAGRPLVHHIGRTATLVRRP